jgi:hypothetical protein
MKLITLRLTTEELRLLTMLAGDQLFRKEFIDPKMPGHKSDSDELNRCKKLVGRLRLMTDPGCSKRTSLLKVNGTRA